MATIPRVVAKSEIKPAVHRERHALLQRILWSRQFERSERLRSFLDSTTAPPITVRRDGRLQNYSLAGMLAPYEGKIFELVKIR